MWFPRAKTEGLSVYRGKHAPRRAEIYKRFASNKLLILAVGATLSACMSHKNINDEKCSSTPTADALPYILDVKDSYISVNNNRIISIDKKPTAFCREKIRNTDVYSMISERYRVSIHYKPHIGKSELNSYLSDKSEQPDMGDSLLSLFFLKSGEDSLIKVYVEEFSR